MPKRLQSQSLIIEKKKTISNSFLIENFVKQPGEKILSSKILEIYNQWASNGNYPKLTYKTLASRMREVGINPDKLKGGVRGYEGIREKSFHEKKIH